MKKAFLIYNPASGRKRTRRAEQITRAAEVFRSAGIHAEAHATTHAGSAAQQTQQAVAAGFDTIIACGGYQPRDVCPGVITYQTKAGQEKRYVIVAAGVGADAELMYRTAVELKERYGMYAYFLEMARLAWRGRLPMFQVEWLAENGAQRSEAVALISAARANRFPGLLRRVRLGGALTRNDYRLMLFKTCRVRHFLSFFASLASGWNWNVPQVELAYASSFRCTLLQPAEGRGIHCEADGELLGTLPVEVSIEARTFKLLMP